MYVAEQAVKHFLSEIKQLSYSDASGKHAEDLADLLDYWLSGYGVGILGQSYENFLQMVVILLTSPQLADGVEFLVLGHNQKQMKIAKRPTTSDWVKRVGRDVFERACAAYLLEHQEE